jgi:hypothetical protein
MKMRKIPIEALQHPGEALRTRGSSCPRWGAAGTRGGGVIDHDFIGKCVRLKIAAGMGASAVNETGCGGCGGHGPFEIMDLRV